VESIIERIERGHFWNFHGGVHPPEQKFLTCDKPIRQLPLPEQLTIPVQQNIGQAGELLVKTGDYVLKGQALTQAKHPMAVPVHAPTSGTITDIKNTLIAHPSGLSELCIILTPDNEDKWKKRQIHSNYQQLSKHDIIEKIADSGIAGMGGAGFPSHIKVSTTEKINYLIINAAECEPYITADDLLMKEQCAAIVDGIKILAQILVPDFILIGIEDNKSQAIKALQHATQSLDKFKVCVLPTKYPTGGEKQLIMSLTGQEVPAGVLPSALGIVMHNIATCFAIADAVINDIPLIKRVVTVTGQALAKPQNVWALLGTPVEFLLKQCAYQAPDKQHIIMGGPMMGFSLSSNKVPIVKISNCILAPSEKEISFTSSKEVECIRCGQCAEVCPSQLLPQELQWSAKAKDQQQLNKLNLFDCIECGACSYVCPSHIPLVHYYRIAKAEIRQQNLLDIKAEKAKERFEARKSRLEREKIAREEKHKKAAEARKARMNAGTPAANKEKSAVAAALARVKAKKALTKENNSENTSTDEKLVEQNISVEQTEKKSQVAAAIARAKAKKLAAKASSNNIEKVVSDTDSPVETTPKDDKKAKVAAAIAKAKAKKRATESTSVKAKIESHNNKSIEDEKEHASSEQKTAPNDVKDSVQVNDKKAKIAAAVAKAKARKSAKASIKAPTNDDTDNIEHSPVNRVIDLKRDEDNSPLLDKKARISAAVAKAKAKKQQAESK